MIYLIAAIIFWSVLLVVGIAVELATQQLVSIWFAAGSLGALIAASAGASVTVQLIVFTALSLLLLIFTRPRVRKALSFGIKDTNAKLDIGKLAVVIQEINPEKGTGRVRLGGADWMAVAAPELVIPAGTTVRVEKIDGAKLYVAFVPDKEKV
ncbi:MAG: NfeD family protein [Oscillospiraceae bacterium]|nr:NfeD family protein [Oscillospiraceae bacterium]